MCCAALEAGLPAWKAIRAQQKSTRAQEVELRRDLTRTRAPQTPVSGPGSAGRVAERPSSIFEYVARVVSKRKEDPKDLDPRQAILRHAKEAEANPYWVDKAYAEYALHLLHYLLYLLHDAALHCLELEFTGFT